MPKTHDWLAMLAIASLGATSPVDAAGGTLTDQAVSLTYGANHWSGDPEADLKGTEPSAATDIVAESGWWYRVNGVDTREHPFPAPSSETWSGSRATIVWDDVDGRGFRAIEELVVLDSERPSGGFISRLTIENPSPTWLDVTLIHYLDASANGTPGGDFGTALYPPGRPAVPLLTFSEGDTTGLYRQLGGASRWMLRTFPELRTLLDDNDVDDLSNLDAPFGPGDWTAAYQWNFALPPATPPLLVRGGGGVAVTSRLPGNYTKGDLLGAGHPGILFRNAVSGLVQNWNLRRAENLVTTTFFGLADAPVAVDDFTGDLVSDLVLRSQATGEVTFQDGATGASVPLSGAPVLPLGWKLAATADFDGNGKPDILWRNAGSGKLVVWTMNGPARSGYLIPSPDRAPSANWEIVGARDFNDDGATDLLWHNNDSGKVAIWYLNTSLMRISGGFTTPARAADANWQMVGAADFGKGPGGVWGTPDLLWRHRISGRLTVWHMDFAGQRTSGEFTTPNGPDGPDWTVVAPR